MVEEIVWQALVLREVGSLVDIGVPLFLYER